MFKVEITHRPEGFRWHSGKRNIFIYREKYINEEYGMGMDWWMIVPIGHPKYGWWQWFKKWVLSNPLP